MTVSSFLRQFSETWASPRVILAARRRVILRPGLPLDALMILMMETFLLIHLMLPEQRMLRFNASGAGGYVSTLFLIHSIAVTILCHIIFNNTSNTFCLFWICTEYIYYSPWACIAISMKLVKTICGFDLSNNLVGVGHLLVFLECYRCLVFWDFGCRPRTWVGRDSLVEPIYFAKLYFEHIWFNFPTNTFGKWKLEKRMK